MTEPVEKIEPKDFTLFTNIDKRLDERYELDKYIDDLPHDRVFTVKIKQGQESRRDCANRLWRLTIGQIVKQTGRDESAVAGYSKQAILLPIKHVYAAETDDDTLKARAEFESELCQMCIERYSGVILYQAFDSQVRSKPPYTSVGLFARFFERHLIDWAGKGVTFRLRPSDKQFAIEGERNG